MTTSTARKVAQRRVIKVKGRSYQVLRKVGAGGQGVVFQVFEPSTEGTFAIKEVSLVGACETTINSYVKEISFLEKLQQYENRVIKMYGYEYDEDEAKLYVVMECGHEDLSQRLRQHGQITAIMRRYYWGEMLEAVKVIHSEGIVHSDLKPSNFLHVGSQLKLIDFGIASSVAPERTSVTMTTPVGTLNYISPEVLRDVSDRDTTGAAGNKTQPRYKVGRASDVWSLGCILYAMVYGRTPFHHIKSMIHKCRAIADDTVPINFPAVDDVLLLDVMKRCLVRDVHRRPTIDELLAHPYLTRDEVVEGDSPTTQHVKREVHRAMEVLVERQRLKHRDS